MKKYLSIILLVVGLGIGFAGGYLFRNYQRMQQRPQVGQRFTPGANGGQRGGFGGGVTGNVISMDDKSVTIKLPDGSSKIVLYQDSTTYSSTLAATKTDLKQGSNIMVFGKANTDGSITADRIQFANAILK